MLQQFHSKYCRIKKMFIFTLSGSVVILLLTWVFTDSTAIDLENSRLAHADVKMCHVEAVDGRQNVKTDLDKNIIYFITPTYPRAEQIPELKRLSYTLMHIERIHWIVADDNPNCNPLLLKILSKTKLPFTLLSSPMPAVFRNSKTKPRGVSNRRAALSWIRTSGNTNKGVLYFGDDDNTYDLELFEEIRSTSKVSMFPVGLIGQYGISSPVVDDGKVIGFFDPWPAQRKWPVDMAGFAVNLKYLKPYASMRYKPGYEEDSFLHTNKLILDDIEPKAANCTRILVWHTKTQNNGIKKIHLDFDKSNYQNLKILLDEAVTAGMTLVSSTGGNQAFITKNRHSIHIS